MMANFVFRCPATGFNVQHRLDDDPDVSENEYEAIACPACTSIHLVNRKTGKLLGRDDLKFTLRSFASPLLDGRSVLGWEKDLTKRPQLNAALEAARRVAAFPANSLRSSRSRMLFEGLPPARHWVCV